MGIFPFTSVAIFGFLGAVLSIGIFFLRIILSYKKGVAYGEKNGNFPKLNDIHYMFFAIGICVPFLLSFIPVVGIIFSIFSFFLLMKILPNLIKMNSAKNIKPEKMVSLGIGLGITGTLAFMFGIYRQISEKNNEGEEMEESV